VTVQPGLFRRQWPYSPTFDPPPPEPPKLPEPEVPARLAKDEEVPRGARTFIKSVESAPGWAVRRCLYARGAKGWVSHMEPNGDGTRSRIVTDVPEIVDVIAVYARCEDGSTLTGYWHAGRVDSIVLRDPVWGYASLNAMEAKMYLANGMASVIEARASAAEALRARKGEA
jgi:hypothetical protein